MQLDFTPDQEELRDSVRSVLDKECTRAVVREHIDHVVRGEPSDAPERLWKTFVSLDWPALTIPEEHGGIGLGYPELARRHYRPFHDCPRRIVSAHGVKRHDGI